VSTTGALSGVVREIRHAGAEAGIELGPDSPADRRALVHALRQLTDWGVITEDDGSVAGYADDPTAEALLWVDRELVRQLLAVPLREVTILRRWCEWPQNQARTVPVTRYGRRIVEEPVVIADELPEDERAWLRQYQRREAQLAEQLFGLRLEIRAEGIAAFDPLEELSDQTFPREGTLGQAALLSIAGSSAACARPRPQMPGRVSPPLSASTEACWERSLPSCLPDTVGDGARSTPSTQTGFSPMSRLPGGDGARCARRGRSAVASGHSRPICARGRGHAPTTTYLRPRGDDMTDQLFGAPDAAVSAASFDDETPSRIGRWVLNRAGIVNVWQYDRAEFRFAGGRTLLRGKTVPASPRRSRCCSRSCWDGDTRTIDASGRDRTTVGWLMSDGATR